MSHWRRLFSAFAALVLIVIAGTIGYVVLGFGLLDAAYQTVTTISTVGFREVEPLSAVGKVFTMALIILGVGTTLYALSVLIETVVEGRIQELYGRRRMQRTLAGISDHVIVCGWGRVGRAIADNVIAAGRSLVVVDLDPERVERCPHPALVGDATEDDVLRQAGLDRARALIAAVDSDAANLFVTVSARALQPDLFIVSRVRSDANEEKLRRAGANRVVNPQQIGGSRMAAFVLQPHVAEFLDVVTHEHNLEFRLEEVAVDEGSPLAGRTVAELALRDQTGAQVLALRDPNGVFVADPPPETVVDPGHVIIAIGTPNQLGELRRLVAAQR